MSALLSKDGLKKSPTILRDDRLCTVCGKILDFHMHRMVKNESGTMQGDDVDALHDMRVAIRRMRVGIDLFMEYFNSKLIDKVRKSLAKSGKILGRVRDLDVMLGDLDNDFNSRSQMTTLLGESLYNELRSIWTIERGKNLRKMTKFLKSERYASIKQNLQEFITISVYEENTCLSGIPLSTYIPDVINGTIRDVYSYEDILHNPTLSQLHSLRIAIKKVRYVLEFFRCLLGGEAEFCIDVLKEAQNCLGRINDSRIAVVRMRKLKKGTAYPTKNADKNDSFHDKLDDYIKFKEGHLSADIQFFAMIWQKLIAGRFKSNLKLAISNISK
jgi:CHAD domain-containing protein